MGGAARKSSRKERADSIRNRERLLAAASEVFAEGGPGASLEAVARRAGVGIGTLYRHFPTREALFLAVYRRDVDAMVEEAARLAGETDPVDALRRWLHDGVRLVATKRGMLAALDPVLDGSSEVFAETSARLIRAASDLMQPGIAAGRLRADIAAEDVMKGFVAICHSSDLPGRQETVLRLLDVFVDGLARWTGDASGSPDAAG